MLVTLRPIFFPKFEGKIKEKRKKEMICFHVFILGLFSTL